jgi:hypothetical protein
VKENAPKISFSLLCSADKRARIEEKNAITETRVHDEGLTLEMTNTPRGIDVANKPTSGSFLICSGRAATRAAINMTAKIELKSLIVRIELFTSVLANQLITQ